jgi:16S rRNA processing protein RimM
MTPAGTGFADDPAWPEDAIEIGRILGPWGVKGALKVHPFSSDPQALFSSRRWFLQPAEPRPGPRPPKDAAAAAIPRLLRITSAKEHGDGVVATAQEVPDRAAAEGLKGARIFISRTSFPTADDGEYYWIDLIGLQVVNRDGAALGTVRDLIDTGAHCVLRLKRDDAPEGAPLDQAERLIPFVAAYVDDVNLAERRITVDWGLDY